MRKFRANNSNSSRAERGSGWALGKYEKMYVYDHSRRIYNVFNIHLSYVYVWAKCNADFYHIAMLSAITLHVSIEQEECEPLVAYFIWAASGVRVPYVEQKGSPIRKCILQILTTRQRKKKQWHSRSLIQSSSLDYQ